MKITQGDLRSNRNSVPQGGLHTNVELKRLIAESWRVYFDSPDDAVANAAYSRWCVLVDRLSALEY